jgi:hypothetical protein
MLRALSLLVLVWAPALDAQALPSEQQVQEVLETSQIEDFLRSLGGDVLDRLPLVAPELDSVARGRIDEVVATAFAAPALESAVIAHFIARSPGGELRAVREWLLSPAFAAIQAKANPDSIGESLDQFILRLEATPPPRERVELVARYVEVQRAGEFYVRLDDQLRSAAQRLAEDGSGSQLPPAPEPTPAEREAQLQQMSLISFLSFLQRFEALTDREAEELLGAYESPSGRWYVDTYTEALLHAIELSTTAALAELP